MAILQPWHLQFSAKFDNAINQKIVRSAEAILVEEMRLGTVPDSSVNPDPEEQGLAAFELVDYAFSIVVDGPLLVLPVGPLTDITALSIDAETVDLAGLNVKPWTIGYRDASSFSCGSSVSISGTIGWSDPLVLPQRIKAAADMLSAYIAEWYDENATIIQRADGEQYFNPRRGRAMKVVERLIAPWTRPQSA